MISLMMFLLFITATESICTLTTNNHYYFVGFTSDGLVNIIQTRPNNVFKRYKECPDLTFLTSLCYSPVSPSNQTLEITDKVKRDTDFEFSLDPFF